MLMDEVEFAQMFAMLRVKVNELDNAPLKEVVQGILELIEFSQDKIKEMLDADDE